MPLDIPNRVFFAYAFQCRYREQAPRINGVLDEWGPEYLVPDLGYLENRPQARGRLHGLERRRTVFCGGSKEA